MPIITTGQITITDANDGYNLSIVGGNRTFSYASSGSTPTPSAAGTFSVSLFRGGVTLTPKSYSWSATGVLSTTATTATFTPTLATNYSVIATTVSVSVEHDGNIITATVPILVSQAPSNAIINTIFVSAPAIYKDSVDAATSGTYTSVTIQGKRYDGTTNTNFGWITVTPNTTGVESARTDTASTALTLSPASNSGVSSYVIKLYLAATGGADVTSQTLNVTFKGAAGAPGTSPVLYELGLSAPVVVRSASNTLTPSSITATGFSTTAGVKSAYSGRFRVYEDGVLKQTSGDVVSYTHTPTTPTVGVLKFEMYATGGTTVLLDTQEAPVVVAGSSAMTFSVTNATYPIPTDSSGAVSTYVGSGTTIQVLEGSELFTYVTTLGTTAKTFAIGTPALSVANAITVGARSGATTTTATVAQHSAMSNSVDSVVITYPLTYVRANGATGTQSVTQAITKVKAGTLGIRGSRQLYSTDSVYNSTYDFDGVGGIAAGAASYAARATQLIATATAGSNPTTPINGDTVTFSNGSNYVYTITHNGTSWVPPGTIIDGSLLVTGSVTASKINSNGLDVRDSTGKIILSAGTSEGITSLSSSTNLVQGFSSWTNTGADTVTPTTLANSWQITIPDGTDPLYVTVATASIEAATDNILATEWSTPVLLGPTGLLGINTATVFLYARNNSSSTAPTLATTGTGTYTFASGVLSGTIPSGWTQAIPATGGTVLWVIQATAASATATASIANTKWSTARVLTETAAIIAPLVYAYRRSATAPTNNPGAIVYTFGTNRVLQNQPRAENGSVLVVPIGSNFISSNSPTLNLMSGTYTLSFRAALTAGVSRILEADLFPDTLPGSTFTIAPDWNDYQVTWTSSNADLANCVLRFFANAAAGQIEISDVKLEAGNKRTAWTPNRLDQPSINNKLTSSNASTYIADAAIGTAQIADLSVDFAKIADSSIGTAKIGQLAVDGLRIRGGAVTFTSIVDIANPPLNGLNTTIAYIDFSSAAQDAALLKLYVRPTGLSPTENHLNTSEVQLSINGTTWTTYSTQEDGRLPYLDGLSVRLGQVTYGGIPFFYNWGNSNATRTLLTQYSVWAPTGNPVTLTFTALLPFTGDYTIHYCADDLINSGTISVPAATVNLDTFQFSTSPNPNTRVFNPQSANQVLTITVNVQNTGNIFGFAAKIVHNSSGQEVWNSRQINYTTNVFKYVRVNASATYSGGINSWLGVELIRK